MKLIWLVVYAFFFYRKIRRKSKKKKISEKLKKKVSDDDSVKRELKLWYVLIVRNFSVTFQKLLNVSLKAALSTTHSGKYSSDFALKFLICFTPFDESRRSLSYQVSCPLMSWLPKIRDLIDLNHENHLQMPSQFVCDWFEFEVNFHLNLLARSELLVRNDDFEQKNREISLLIN